MKETLERENMRRQQIDCPGGQAHRKEDSQPPQRGQIKKKKIRDDRHTDMV